MSERRFRKKKKVRPSIFSVWLHGVEKNERFFFSENGPDDGQAPLGYPQKQYEDGGPPLFLSRSEDIRAGDGPSAYYGRWFCGVPLPERLRPVHSWIRAKTQSSPVIFEFFERHAACIQPLMAL